MKMTEILLLGTFHFLESDIDFYTEEAQAALEALTGRLAAFSPDCIAVEGACSQQAAVDESYRRLKLSEGMGLLVLSLALGKSLGSIFYFLQGLQGG